MAIRIQLRRDTSVNWTANNTVLAEGEAAFETDTGLIKIGNGVLAWTDLEYLTTPGGGGGGESLLVEQIDHLRTPKPIRESPFGSNDAYIIKNKLGSPFTFDEETGEISIQPVAFPSEFWDLIEIDGVINVFPKGQAPQLATPSIRSFYNSTTNGTPNPKEITVDFEGCPVGDLMIATFGIKVNFGGTYPSQVYTTAPSGWTPIVDIDDTIQIFGRIRQEGDSNLHVFTYAHTNSPSVIALSVRDYSAGFEGIVIGDVSSKVNSSPKTTTGVALSKESLCLGFHVSSSNQTDLITFNEGWNKEIETVGVIGSLRRMALASKTTDTSSGDMIATLTPGANNNAGIIIAF